MLFQNISITSKSAHCRSGKKYTPGKAIGKKPNPPLKIRGPDFTAKVQTAQPFNQAILAEQKIHFNVRIATKAYYF
jgi:hypothetical protein